MNHMPNLLDRLVGLYAPHTCIGCDIEGTVFCEQCVSSLLVPVACCYRCGKSSAYGRTCRECRVESLLVSVNCATLYAEPAKSLIWRLKFDRAQAAAEVMGRRLAELYGPLLRDDVLVVPVPTAGRRIRARGYDQAVLIARAFAKHSGLTYAPLLSRWGSQEQKGADSQQRRTQLRGAFRAARPAKIAGQRIMLIDDVITTGSTLEEAATVLKHHGVRSIAAMVFARVRK